MRFSGGGKEIRTPDIVLAKHVLYQLSYTPRGAPGGVRPAAQPHGGQMVGLSGLEPLTSHLSGGCSNQLSYKPGWFSWCAQSVHDPVGCARRSAHRSGSVVCIAVKESGGCLTAGRCP
jgi:hypothetical protein